MRRFALGAAALLAVALATTSIGQAAGETVVAFARDAAKLGGYSPSKRSKKNTVVVRDARGKIDAASLPDVAGFTRVVLDSRGDFGRYNSVTIGADGLGLIAYTRLTKSWWEVKVAHCSNAICSSATKKKIVSGARVAGQGDIAIGADGVGILTYYQLSPRYELRIARCANVVCSSVSAVPIEEGPTAGASSITIGADGLPLVAHFKPSPQPNIEADLKVVHCENPGCTAFTNTRLAGTSLAPAITTGADGLGLITHRSPRPPFELSVAHCATTACDSATLSTIDRGGYSAAITVGKDGRALISYVGGGELRVAHCLNMTCSAATTTTIDQVAYPFYSANTSITIGADGLGLISYYHAANGDLKVAHCVNVACSEATVSTVSTARDVGSQSSVTIGSDGLPLISYYDATRADLEVAHCSNAFCVPYFRRR